MKILISINVEVAGEPSPGVDNRYTTRLHIGNSGAVLRSEAHLT